MAERSGFFNSNNGDRRYKADFFAEYFASFIGNGVFPNPSTGLQVVSNNDMTVTVKAGQAWINGYIYINDNDLILPIEVADGVLNRIDRIVVQFNTVNREIKAIVKKGTFASSPVTTELKRDADAYELALADVYIKAGAISIVQANITDLRFNTEMCGIVKGVVDQVDTTDLFTQFQNAFNIWFEHIKGQLSTDAAGNLQNQLDTWNDFKNNGGTIGGSVEVDAIKNKTTVSTGGKTKTLYSGNLNNIDPSFGLEVVDDKTGYDTKVEVVQPGNPTSGGQGYFGSSHDLSTNLGSDTKRWKDVWVGDFLKADSGYTKLPNGFILQWGTYYSTTIPINGAGGGTISYPIQFPNACINLILTPDLHARGANYALDARLTSDITTSKSNFEFVFINDSSSTWGGLFYIAIGY